MDEGYWDIFNENHDKLIRIHNPDGLGHVMLLSWDGGQTFEQVCKFPTRAEAGRMAQMLVDMLDCNKIKLN